MEIHHGYSIEVTRGEMEWWIACVTHTHTTDTVLNDLGIDPVEVGRQQVPPSRPHELKSVIEY